MEAVLGTDSGWVILGQLEVMTTSERFGASPYFSPRLSPGPL